MTNKTEIRYTAQFCRAGYEIGGGLYAADDADLVRYWEGDFALVELTRTSTGWEPTGGDSIGWTDLAERYAEPIDALYALLPESEYVLIDTDA